MGRARDLAGAISGGPLLTSATLASFASGDPGQPKIIGQAAALINSYPPITISASNAYVIVRGLGYQELLLNGGADTNPPTTVGRRYTVETFTGAARFQITFSGQSRMALYKNNTLIQQWTNSTDVGFGATTATVDVSIQVGDVIEWRQANATTSHPWVNGGAQTAIVTGSNTYIVAELFKPVL